jgi:WD40 repeat protein
LPQLKSTRHPLPPSAINDLAFNPFNDNVLATGGEDGTVKIWSVPEAGVTENLTKASANADFTDPLRCLKWHPSAANTLATGFKVCF